MSATLTMTAVASTAVFSAATVVAATLPEAQAVLSPVLEGGNEYLVAASSLLLSIPMLGILAILAASSRD